MSYAESYAQIRSIRTIKDNQRRGLLYEQALRELVPWTFRPPLAVIGESEQIDAFFEWNSWHFLVEAKAKKKPITRGSHDWEDFELKVRKRKGGCIGLFCSLFYVADGIEEAARTLNRDGYCTLLLHGTVWDELGDENLPFDYLLRYMVLHARSQFRPIPPPIKEVRAWSSSRDETSSDLTQTCRHISSTFLRRHAHPRHSDIYVPRSNDTYLLTMADELRPSQLRNIWRKKERAGDISIHNRETPRQICLFRDVSGNPKPWPPLNRGCRPRCRAMWKSLPRPLPEHNQFYTWEIMPVKSCWIN